MLELNRSRAFLRSWRNPCPWLLQFLLASGKQLPAKQPPFQISPLNRSADTGFLQPEMSSWLCLDYAGDKNQAHSEFD
jgi:hypothetical protein